jgi:hypothetical protein
MRASPTRVIAIPTGNCTIKTDAVVAMMQLIVFTACMIVVPSFGLVPSMVRSRHGCIHRRMNPLADNVVAQGYWAGGYNAALTSADTTTTLNAARRTPPDDAVKMSQNKLQRRSAVSTTTTTAALSTSEYIDDCFGLIGLTGLFVANDVWFTVVFVALSTMALLATRAGLVDVWMPASWHNVERQRRLEPGLVAAATLLTSTLTAAVVASLWETLSPTDMQTWLDRDANAPLIEAVVCAVSIIYGVAPIQDDA